MIIELKEEDKEWNEFLKDNEHRIYHTPKFKKFIESSFKLKPAYLAYKDDNKIKTILPITIHKSRLFGNKIVSVGILEYGGFAGDEKHTVEIIEHIKQKYKDLDYAEIRQGLDKFKSTLDKELDNKKQKRFTLQLTTSEDLWKNIQKEKRKAIKKSEKELITRELSEEDIEEIYSLYLKNMRSFGTPPYPKKFFINFFRLKLGKCFGSFYNNKLVSTLLGYTYNDRIHVIIANANPKFLKYRCNDSVHWTFIKWGCNNNYKTFDFGIVKENSGHFEYKKKWGAILKDLNRHIIYLKKKNIKDPDPKDPKLKILITIYKRMPLWTTKIAGKIFREGLGI